MDEIKTLQNFVGWTVSGAHTSPEGRWLEFKLGDQERHLQLLGGDFGTVGKVREISSQNDSRLLRFYIDGEPDDKGQTFEEVLQWSDDEIEQTHDFVQWWFPLPEPSRFNKTAPLLTDSVLKQLRESNDAAWHAQKAVDRMLEFYGLRLWGWRDDMPAHQRDFWIVRHGLTRTDWIAPNNHNFLRLTRILRFCALMELRHGWSQTEFYAPRLLTALEAVAAISKGAITETTLAHWRAAAEGLQPAF